MRQISLNRKIMIVVILLFSSTYQNFWDATKTLLRRKFISLDIYIRKVGPQTNFLTFHISTLKKVNLK